MASLTGNFSKAVFKTPTESGISVSSMCSENTRLLPLQESGTRWTPFSAHGPAPPLGLLSGTAAQQDHRVPKGAVQGPLPEMTGTVGSKYGCTPGLNF